MATENETVASENPIAEAIGELNNTVGEGLYHIYSALRDINSTLGGIDSGGGDIA